MIGSVGTDRSYIWVVEEQYGDRAWIAWDNRTRPTRARARRLAQWVRRESIETKTRVRKYVRVDDRRRSIREEGF